MIWHLTRTATGQYFRASVGALLIDPKGRVLVARRADLPSDQWQLPQGGLLNGEDPEDALKREIREEIGLAPGTYRIIARLDEWLVYQLPPEMRSKKTGRGQAQMWFLCRVDGDTAKILTDNIEFDAWKWVDPDALPSIAVDFRRSIYSRLLKEFASHLSQQG